MARDWSRRRLPHSSTIILLMHPTDIKACQTAADVRLASCLLYRYCSYELNRAEPRQTADGPTLHHA